MAAELEAFDTGGVRVERHALAEASVAVVVPFSYSPRPGSAAIEGVFKILKPGIEARLEEELVIWDQLGAFVDGRCADYGLPEIHYADTLSSVGRLLASEVHLDREQAHMLEARRLFGAGPVAVPGLLPFCTPRLTAMERVEGTKVTESDGLSRIARIGLADRIVESLIARPLWTPNDPSLFHADPHAGNLLRKPDGTLAILDWSLVGRLGKREREQLVQILLCALRLDRAAVARAIGSLSETGIGETALRALVDKAVSGLFASGPPGFRWLLNLLDETTLQGGAKFGQSMLFFRKSILTLDGVLADIASEDRLEQVMSRTGLFRIMGEWPLRSWASPASRSFGSHISNLDLFSLYWSLPEVSLQLWRHWLDSGR